MSGYLTFRFTKQEVIEKVNQDAAKFMLTDEAFADLTDSGEIADYYGLNCNFAGDYWKAISYIEQALKSFKIGELVPSGSGRNRTWPKSQNTVAYSLPESAPAHLKKQVVNIWKTEKTPISFFKETWGEWSSVEYIVLNDDDSICYYYKNGAVLDAASVSKKKLNNNVKSGAWTQVPPPVEGAEIKDIWSHKVNKVPLVFFKNKAWDWNNEEYVVIFEDDSVDYWYKDGHIVNGTMTAKSVYDMEKQGYWKKVPPPVKEEEVIKKKKINDLWNDLAILDSWSSPVWSNPIKDIPLPKPAKQVIDIWSDKAIKTPVSFYKHKNDCWPNTEYVVANTDGTVSLWEKNGNITEPAYLSLSEVHNYVSEGSWVVVLPPVKMGDAK